MGTVSAEDLLAESIRILLIVKHENQQRIEILLAGVKPLAGAIPLSSHSRTRYVEEYQQLVLSEADSAVSQPLKELWLSLSSAAESGLGNGE